LVRLPDGVKVAWVEVDVTTPVTGVPPWASVKLTLVRVDWFIASLKLATNTGVRDTPVALLTGAEEITAGTTATTAATVVKDQV
jgi:hypothetical protein